MTTFRMRQLIDSKTGNVLQWVENIEYPNTSIPLDPDNGIYRMFKQSIFDDGAELQDFDGNLMPPEEAKAYVATLP